MTTTEEKEETVILPKPGDIIKYNGAPGLALPIDYYEYHNRFESENRFFINPNNSFNFAKSGYYMVLSMENIETNIDLINGSNPAKPILHYKILLNNKIWYFWMAKKTLEFFISHRFNMIEIINNNEQ